jgi:hypothetical protein
MGLDMSSGICYIKMARRKETNMSTNYTITLSLGSGPDAEILASQIKSWAGQEPVSKAIRNLLKSEIAKNPNMGLLTHNDKPNK